MILSNELDKMERELSGEKVEKSVYEPMPKIEP